MQKVHKASVILEQWLEIDATLAMGTALCNDPPLSANEISVGHHSGSHVYRHVISSPDPCEIIAQSYTFAR
jgi:hypothetical protein